MDGEFVVGSVIWMASSYVPESFLICDGSSISAAQYQVLTGIIGTSYGGSNGLSKLPNLVGRTIIGTNSAAKGEKHIPLGQTGGYAETHNMLLNKIPQHTHNAYFYFAPKTGDSYTPVTNCVVGATPDGGFDTENIYVESANRNYIRRSPYVSCGKELTSHKGTAPKQEKFSLEPAAHTKVGGFICCFGDYE